VNNLLSGASDSLNILAFKWKSVRPKNQRIWIVVAAMFAMAIVMVAAYGGSAFRILISNSTGQDPTIRETLLLWINIFLANNASLATGGIIWALLASIVLIPLVGYSFTSIVPEGDLASIKITSNHKISDSILLQFVSSISFIQIIALTALSSILTIGSDRPGLAIVTGWGLWVVSVLLTVLAAWAFELLHRKFGIKAKLVSFAAFAGTAGILYLSFPKDFAGMFGVGEAYTSFIQGLRIEDFGAIASVIGIFVICFVAISYLISITAARTLELPERVKKKDMSKVLLARLGLSERNKISGISQFLANMIFRQNNIWKPLLLSISFAIIMAVIFFAFYQVLFTVSTLIPIMISLVWSVNIFGILGSGTTWLVSLPQGKKKILGSIALIQYIIITMIVFVIMGLLLVIYQPPLNIFIEFLLATTGASIVITQFSLNKAVNFPYRYRVHIRGESILPPNKAFSYMAKLFMIGFATSGLIYGLGLVRWDSMGYPSYTGMLMQLATVIVIGLMARLRFVALRRKWMYDANVLQNIIKTVGS
jgi:hypothetical protein